MNIRSIAAVPRAYQEQVNISQKNKDRKIQNPKLADEVVLSSQALEYSYSTKAIKNIPDIREAKVAELSERIAAGAYHIPAEEIAAAIITYSK